MTAVTPALAVTLARPAPRKSARSMLAMIALERDLPMPTMISFSERHGLTLHFATIADGVAWARLVDLSVQPYLNTDGHRYLGSVGLGLWHDWPVNPWPCERAEPVDQLDDADAAAVTALAEEPAEVAS